MRFSTSFENSAGKAVKASRRFRASGRAAGDKDLQVAQGRAREAYFETH